MLRQHGPERPRDDRGRSSWARRLNAETGELVAALARLATIAYALSASLGLLFAVLALDWVWAAGAALAAVQAGGCYWLGFVHLANPEWKEGPPDVDAD